MNASGLPRVTDVFVVSDAATHAIVYRAGEEVMRLPLNLSAEELNVVRL